MTKQEIYDRLCRLLTDYEHRDENDGSILEWTDELYSMLCEIQNRWEDVITAQD